MYLEFVVSTPSILPNPAIHGITQDGWIFPLVYAVLPNKKTTSYKYLFDELSKNEYVAILRPDTVLLDFERATMRAIREVYSGVELQGCHFHSYSREHVQSA
jgi:hypothetical protein